MNYIGGYQLIDCGNVTITYDGPAVTIVNSELAEQFRNDKLKIISELNMIKSGVSKKYNGISLFTTNTGTRDGAVSAFLIDTNLVYVTTDDDKVTFTQP